MRVETCRAHIHTHIFRNPDQFARGHANLPEWKWPPPSHLLSSSTSVGLLIHVLFPLLQTKTTVELDPVSGKSSALFTFMLILHLKAPTAAFPSASTPSREPPRSRRAFDHAFIIPRAYPPRASCNGYERGKNKK